MEDGKVYFKKIGIDEEFDLCGFKIDSPSDAISGSSTPLEGGYMVANPFVSLAALVAQSVSMGNFSEKFSGAQFISPAMTNTVSFANACMTSASPSSVFSTLQLAGLAGENYSTCSYVSKIVSAQNDGLISRSWSPVTAADALLHRPNTDYLLLAIDRYIKAAPSYLIPENTSISPPSAYASANQFAYSSGKLLGINHTDTNKNDVWGIVAERGLSVHIPGYLFRTLDTGPITALEPSVFTSHGYVPTINAMLTGVSKYTTWFEQTPSTLAIGCLGSKPMYEVNNYLGDNSLNSTAFSAIHLATQPRGYMGFSRESTFEHLAFYQPSQDNRTIISTIANNIVREIKDQTSLDQDLGSAVQSLTYEVKGMIINIHCTLNIFVNAPVQGNNVQIGFKNSIQYVKN